MKYLILIMTFLISTMAFSQVRDVYYMTGFPSDTESDNTNTRWIQTLNNHATRSSINPMAFGYINADGLQVGATSAVSKMNGTNIPSQAIAIGASFGGTVIRQIDANGPAPFGGFITVGSPHKGTLLAKKVNDDPAQILNTVQGWIADVLAGPTGHLQGLASLSIGGDFIIDETLSFITENIPFAKGLPLGEMVNNPSQTTKDLSSSSSAITSLNNFNTNLPFVQITVEEDEPQSLFRMVGSKKAHEATLGQHDDSKRVVLADVTAGVYEGFKILHYTMIDAGSIFGFVINAINGNELLNNIDAKATAWERGQQALESNIESDWQQLVGGTTTTITNSTEVVGCDLEEFISICDSYSDGALPQACIEYYDNNTTPCDAQSTNVTYELPVILPNDSYIPVSYQVFDEDIAVLPVLGCNHNEIVNHSGVIQAMESILDGGQASFFISPK